MARKLLKKIDVRRGRTILLMLLAVAGAAWGCYALVDELRIHDPERMRVAAGSAVARRFQIAQYLAKQAGEAGIEMDIVANAGFEESMRQLADGTVDMALVSSGLESAEAAHVQVLAGLDVAPLHVLVRRELAEQGISLVEAVKGRRVNVGAVGTNDRELASDVLAFLQLRGGTAAELAAGKCDYEAEDLTKDEIEAQAEDVQELDGAARERVLRQIPDVVLTIASLPSPVVQELLDTGEYALAPFPYAEPYLLSGLGGKKEVDDRGEYLDRSYVEAAAVPTAMYVGDKPTPAENCPTIGLRTLLVAREGLSKPLVQHLMHVMFETDFTRQIKPLSPRQVATTYSIHDGAAAYLDRNAPFITSEFCENLSGALSLFGAFSAGALSLYSYLRRRKIRRPDEYIEQIRTVDAMFSQPEGDVAALKPDAMVRELDTRLIKLKEQLIHDYCNKKIEGEMVVLSILSMVADSRAELRRATRDGAGGATGDGANTHASLSNLEVGALRVA